MFITKSKNGFADYPGIPRTDSHEPVRPPESHHWTCQPAITSNQNINHFSLIAEINCTSIHRISFECTSTKRVFFSFFNHFTWRSCGSPNKTKPPRSNVKKKVLIFAAIFGSFYTGGDFNPESLFLMKPGVNYQAKRQNKIE